MSSRAQIERLGRASQVSGLLMALGTLVVAAALWLSYAQLRALQGEVASLASEATRLQKQSNDLREDAEKMRREIGGLREALAASRYAIEAFHQRDYSTAVSLYDQALHADPNNAYLLNLKAYSLFKLKRIGEAIEVQRQSLRVDPEYAWGYFDLARFQCATGLFDEARGSIDRAIEKRPGLQDIMAKDGEFQRLCGPINVIVDFADRLCKSSPLQGQQMSLELSSTAKAELNEVVRKIVDLGIEGAAKYKNSEFQGFLQKDLAAIVKDSTDCRREVWRDLKDKLVPKTTESSLPN